jgi:hypothetical protein
MDPGWKIVSVCLRLWELIYPGVICSIVGGYILHLNDANVGVNLHAIFAIVMAAISIFRFFTAVALAPPYQYSFWTFPFDACLFLCWMVVLGLLMEVGKHLVRHETWSLILA